jgi:hypothetical protein
MKKIIIYVCSIVFLITSHTLLSQISYVRNSSFEQHAANVYPNGLTPSYYGGQYGTPGYYDNELIKCIGFCKSMLELESTYICKKNNLK